MEKIIDILLNAIYVGHAIMLVNYITGFEELSAFHVGKK